MDGKSEFIQFTYLPFFQVLQAGFLRCTESLNSMTKPNETPVQCCSNIAKCYAVAAQFEGCREKITEIPGIVSSLCGCLYYKVSLL